MKYIEDFLNGEISIPQFHNDILYNNDVINTVNSLIPKVAFYSENHDLWSMIAYSAFVKYNFNLVNYLLTENKYSNFAGDNLNIWGTIEIFYHYHNPDFKAQANYRAVFDLYLDVVREYFEGPEVNSLIDRIVSAAWEQSGKANKRKYAKQLISENFKYKDKKPRWIQGGEWPMGQNRPMTFVNQEKMGEKVHYHFLDEDSTDTRTIIQYY